MRYLLCAGTLGLALLGGCGKAKPTMAGGRPVAHWMEELRSPDARARKKAAHKLGNAGVVDPSVVPALVEALKDADAGVRAEAVLALLKIGPAAREAVPALTAAQNDPDATVRAYAAKALEKVQGGK